MLETGYDPAGGIEIGVIFLFLCHKNKGWIFNGW